MRSSKVSTLVTEPGLLEIADRLYSAPLNEFTAARDFAAKSVRSGPSADRALAARIKELRKPSTAAWVVNLMVRTQPEQVTEILQIAQDLRAAQETMAGDELRSLTRQRRQLTAAVTTQARALAADQGVRVTDAVAEQVETTITAALLDERAAAAFRSGLLVQSLSAIGFADVDTGAVVALVEAVGHIPASPAATVPRADLHVVPDPEAAATARKLRETALVEAEARVSLARAEHEEARSAHTLLQARLLQRRTEAEELRRRLIDVESSLATLDEELGEAELAESEARRILGRLEAQRDRARHDLNEIGTSH
jgi:hypothetical protein